MKFLWPGGGVTNVYGIMTTPGHFGIVAGIAAGLPWAADNQAFTKGFQPDTFFRWLEMMQPYRATNLFVPCPDRVGDAVQTLALFERWHAQFAGWSLAFVAQDGQENLDFPAPELWHTLFVGGSTAWKESAAAIETIRRAQELGKHIHIGRVNWHRRYKLFAQIRGSEKFTCDGTRPRYGKDQALIDWKRYEEETNVFKLW